MSEILVPLMGGLGNQLFQIAAGLELQARTTRNVLFTDLLLNHKYSRKVTPRDFDSRCFLNSHEIKKASHLTKLQLALATHNLFGSISKENLLPDGSSYGVTDGSRFLIGYFQNYKTVDLVQSVLIDRFLPFITAVQESYKTNENTIGIHIRFGDYLSNPETRKFHGLTSLSYYEKAVKHVQTFSDINHVTVFSDDRIRAKQLLMEFKDTQIDFDLAPITKTPVDDLLLLSTCEAIIGSNSTFSWWSSWIASVLYGTPIVLPSPWFAVQKPEEELLYFPSAVRLQRDIAN